MVDSATLWWVLAAVLVGVELLTGTFYLLMLAVGAAAGALAGYAGLGLNAQMGVASAVGVAATLLWHFKRKRTHKELPVHINRNANLDIGQTVQVDEWLPDGTSQVRYRGAQWSVQAAAGEAPEPGMHRIREVIANRLVVEKI